jgi:hypothetical protein
MPVMQGHGDLGRRTVIHHQAKATLSKIQTKKELAVSLRES